MSLCRVTLKFLLVVLLRSVSDSRVMEKSEINVFVMVVRCVGWTKQEVLSVFTFCPV